MPDDLVERALALSGRTLRAFAEELLVRDERTVRRWRRGEITVPAVARRWLERYVREQSG